MKITDIQVVVARGEAAKPLYYTLASKPKDMTPRPRMVAILRVLTDEGIEGNCSVATAPELITGRLKPELLGEDPLEREKIWQKMVVWHRHITPMHAIGPIDIALWDIAGKYYKTPIYKLLGIYRHKILAYASTYTYDTIQEYIDVAMECRKKGFKGFKPHAWGVPERDIELCRALKKALGDTMLLMWDAVGSYDRAAAMKVGRVMEELGFYWYEEPMLDQDIDGYVDLCRALDIPVAATEGIYTGLGDYSEKIVRGATDILRDDASLNGGITCSKKIAALGEAFGMKLEPHSYGHALSQAANLHVMCAIKNCDFFESPVPEGLYDLGMKEGIRVDKEGYVHVPQKPGLGLEIDWDWVKAHTVATLT